MDKGGAKAERGYPGPTRGASAAVQLFLFPFSVETIKLWLWTLDVPRLRSRFGDRSFAAARPRLRNSLPANLRQI